MGPMLEPNDAIRPRDVGVLAMEVYFPCLAVDQAELEKHDGVEGKYTKGLGQSALGLCGDQEDAVSMALSAASSLLRKYSIEPSALGRLDVGTESDLDSAKPVKSFLMQLLGSNANVEGSDHRAACYGGTAALLSAVDWVAGEGWDGRLAMVVTTDISVYSEPAARATGGAGAVAMLVGPDAPLVVLRRSVSSHCCDTYDWYKPNGPIPQVDGKLSVATYLDCLERCFHGMHAKCTTSGCSGSGRGVSGGVLPAGMVHSAFDYAVLHHPYNKLVQKGAALLEALLDNNNTGAAGAWENQRRQQQQQQEGNGHAASASRAKEPTDAPGASNGATARSSNSSRSSDFYSSKVWPSTLLGRECGNMYTGSLYAGLASLVAASGADLYGRRLLMYSFGSGAMSSMFFVQCRRPLDCRWDLGGTQAKLDLCRRLGERKRVTPEQLEGAIAAQVANHGKAGWRPGRELLKDSDMWPGAFRLVEVDARHRRRYKQRQQAEEEEEEEMSLAVVPGQHGGTTTLQEEEEGGQPCLKKQRTGQTGVRDAESHHPEA